MLRVFLPCALADCSRQWFASTFFFVFWCSANLRKWRYLAHKLSRERNADTLPATRLSCRAAHAGNSISTGNGPLRCLRARLAVGGTAEAGFQDQAAGTAVPSASSSSRTPGRSGHAGGIAAPRMAVGHICGLRPWAEQRHQEAAFGTGRFGR